MSRRVLGLALLAVAVLAALPGALAAPTQAIPVAVAVEVLDPADALPAAEVAGLLEKLGIPYAYICTPFTAKYAPPCCTVIGATSPQTSLAVLPGEIVKAEAVAAQLPRSLPGVVAVPRGPLSAQALSALRHAGASLVIEPHSGPPAVLEACGSVVVRAPLYPFLVGVDGRPSMLVVRPRAASLEEVKAAIRGLAVAARLGWVKPCSPASFLALARRSAVPAPCGSVEPKPASGSEQAWARYRAALEEVAACLSRLGAAGVSRYALLIYGSVDTTPFFGPGRYSPEDAAGSLEKLVDAASIVCRAAGDYACYYLTDVDPRKLYGRKFRVIVLEFGEGVSRADVERLKRSGATVLGYVNLGYAESWRPYWQLVRLEPWVHGQTEYAGEYFVEYWRSEWISIVMAEVERAHEMGFDGVYLDNVDACVVLEELRPSWTSGLNLTRLMAETVREISRTAKAIYGPGFKVYVNIGSAAGLLADESFLSAVDGVLREELWYTATGGHVERVPSSETHWVLRYLLAARLAGKVVIVADPVSSAEMAQEFCKLCWSYGFTPLPQPVWALDYSEPPPTDWLGG